MKRLLILGGTGDAAALAEAVQQSFGDGIETINSLAGRTRQPRELAGRVRTGGFGGPDGLARYLRKTRVDLVVDATHPFGIGAWRAHAGAGNVQPAMALDASATDWPLGTPGMAPARGLTAIICVNVVHISPWAVTEGLFAGARRHLAPDGFLYLYGPYMRDGAHTSDGNVQFDASLRAQNAAWGIRDTADIGALAARNGLAVAETVAMPANNLSLFLTFDKDG